MTLTEEYLKNNLITAYFVDNERKNIEVLTTSEDKKITLSTIIPFDENFVSFKALTKFINIDQLHELTHKKNKDARELFEKQVIDIAKKDPERYVVIDASKPVEEISKLVLDAFLAKRKK